MKTKVKIRNDYHQGIFKANDIGYVDGYVRGGNDVPLAAIVCNGYIDLVPIHNLIVLSE